jgi:hypothetical protein
MLEASGVPTAVGFKGAAEAAEAKNAVAPIMERIVFIPKLPSGCLLRDPRQHFEFVRRQSELP